MAIAANKPYLIDVNINADQNPGGAGVWELPGLGEVSAPAAVLIRPDGHVVWAGDVSDPELPRALTTWFGERVVGSGSGVAAQKSLPGNRTEFTFKWAKPGFPGTIIAGKFLEPITAGNMRVYVNDAPDLDVWEPIVN